MKERQKKIDKEKNGLKKIGERQENGTFNLMVQQLRLEYRENHFQRVKE